MRIIFDTNPIFEDFSLAKPQMLVLEDYLSRISDQLVIPQVVVEEVIRQFKRKYIETRSKYENVRKTLRYVGRDLHDLPELNVVLEEYRSLLMMRLGELNAMVLPIPDICVMDLLKRDLAERKPFSSSGKGFRDTLIWEAIVKSLKDNSEEIVIISNDDAFKSGKEGDISLHPHLADELKSLNLSKTKVTVYPNLQTFNDVRIIPTLKRFFKAGDSIEGSVAEGLNPQDMLVRYQAHIHLEVFDHLLDALSIKNGSLGQARIHRWPEKVELLEAYGLGEHDVQAIIRASMLMDTEVSTDQQGFDTILGLSSNRNVILMLQESRWNSEQEEYLISIRVWLTPTIAITWDKENDSGKGTELVHLDLSIERQQTQTSVDNVC
jgi:hypothetical protein